MTPPVNPNPASSLPQQKKRWQVIDAGGIGTRTIACGNGVLIDDVPALLAFTIAEVHNATLSEPKPEEKSLGNEAPTTGELSTVQGPMKLLGGIDALTQPDYHALNVHCGRNDRLLHATLCAYTKWHLDCPNIGSIQLSDILHNAICESIGDASFVEWVDKIKRG